MLAFYILLPLSLLFSFARSNEVTQQEQIVGIGNELSSSVQSAKAVQGMENIYRDDCPPICLMYCQYGFKEVNGCPICACRSAPSITSENNEAVGVGNELSNNAVNGGVSCSDLESEADLAKLAQEIGNDGGDKCKTLLATIASGSHFKKEKVCECARALPKLDYEKVPHCKVPPIAEQLNKDVKSYEDKTLHQIFKNCRDGTTVAGATSGMENMMEFENDDAEPLQTMNGQEDFFRHRLAFRRHRRCRKKGKGYRWTCRGWRYCRCRRVKRSTRFEITTGAGLGLGLAGLGFGFVKFYRGYIGGVTDEEDQETMPLV